jgi:hypothetical protein
MHNEIVGFLKDLAPSLLLLRCWHGSDWPHTIARQYGAFLVSLSWLSASPLLPHGPIWWNSNIGQCLHLSYLFKFFLGSQLLAPKLSLPLSYIPFGDCFKCPCVILL